MKLDITMQQLRNEQVFSSGVTSREVSLGLIEELVSYSSVFVLISVIYMYVLVEYWTFSKMFSSSIVGVLLILFTS